MLSFVMVWALFPFVGFVTNSGFRVGNDGFRLSFYRVFQKEVATLIFNFSAAMGSRIKFWAFSNSHAVNENVHNSVPWDQNEIVLVIHMY
jgi:uncharacterized membrane protein